MPRCSRKGCGKEYTENSEDPCIFHPGAPVFHEGLKSWSCCSDVYKPVLDFDEFMKVPGCTQTECHTTETPKVEPPKAVPLTTVPSEVNPKFTMSESVAGQEIYTTALPQPKIQSTPASTVLVEEEDDHSKSVSLGTVCRRKGCGTKFVSDEVNRLGDGEGTVCKYHSAPPIFREGSKGYLCCKRRVLEFDEFLKIEGCKTGRHVFVPKAEEGTKMATCRVDHYQTVDKVHVSIFAKQADKERSSIQMFDEQVSVDLALPGSKRFVRTLNLFGPIEPLSSTYQFFGTKVELQLRKRDGRSWTLLEKTTQDLGNISLTFGVGGRTGTIGGKELVLDESNKVKA